MLNRFVFAKKQKLPFFTRPKNNAKVRNCSQNSSCLWLAYFKY